MTRSDNAPYRSIAHALLKTYEFPVMMILSYPNGTVVHAINANILLDMEGEKAMFLQSGLDDPASVLYSKFLKTGIEKAGQKRQEHKNDKDEL